MCHANTQANESLSSAIDTSRELHRQQEQLDRCNHMLDKMDDDLKQSKRAMRVISSPFGGIINYFARDGKKKDKASAAPQRAQVTKAHSSGSERQSSSWQEQRSSNRGGYESSGNTVVDDNLDQVEQALSEMKRVGLEIGNQLDHSIVTIDELNTKVTDRDGRIIDLNRKIGRKIG